MHRLASLSLANRALIALVTAAIAFFGVISMTSLKQELIPSVSLPMVSVVTSLPGASPQVIDEDVSKPVESSLQGLEGLESTTTTSSANVSTVMVEFTYGTDLVYAQQRIQVALNRIENSLPDGATTNVVAGSIDDFPVIQLAVVGGDTDDVANLVRLEALGDLGDVEGVREAALSGASSPRIEITPDQALLAQYGISTQSITDALDASGALIPIGQVTEGDETLTVQAGALLASADDIAAIALPDATPPEGATGLVTIGDVANVSEQPEPVTSISRVNGEDALTISVTKRPDANTVAVSQGVAELIPTLESKLGGDVSIEVVFDQAPYIEQSIETLVVEGLLGLVFAVLVIFVFLLSVRATIVTAISIPTSLLVTFIGLQAADYSLNILTLGALTMAIGRVVDDSIVVIENINRHMKLHPAAGRRGPERAAVIATAVKEVASAITASTISTVAVFLPIAFVSDISGELFRPFALTSVIALMASLIVSLTIVPVLAYWMLAGTSGRSKRRAPAVAGGGPAPDDLTAAGAAREPVLVGAAGAVGAAESDGELRRIRPAEMRAAADREAFSPLGLRDEEPGHGTDTESRDALAFGQDPALGAWGAAADTGEATEASEASRASALDSSTGAGETAAHAGEERPAVKHDVLTPTDLPRDPETGEITLSRRELRELRDHYGDEAVDDVLAAAQDGPVTPNAGAPFAAPDSTLRSQPEQQQFAQDGSAGTVTVDGVDSADSASAPADLDELLDDEPRTWLQKLYDPILAWTLRRPAITLLAAVLVLVGTGLLAPLMQTNFLGEMGGNTISVTQTLPANASLDARDSAAAKAEEALLATEGIETVQLTISGGGDLMSAFMGGGGGATATFSIITSDDADVAVVTEAARTALEGLADSGEFTIGQAAGGGFSSDMTVEVTAPTNEVLTEATQQVTDALAGEEGIVEVTNTLDETRPFVQLTVDAQDAAQYGLTELMVGGMVAQQMQPTPVGDLVIDGETVSIYMVSSDEPPASLDELRDLQIPTALGPIALSSIASVDVVDGPVSMTSTRGTPTATITVVPESGDLSTTTPLVQGVLDGLDLPAGATTEIGGVSADQAAAFEQLGLALLAAILIVYIVMVATFKSLLQPFLLLISIPFAATGAILLQVVTGVPLGVSSIIGVLMLVGIVVTNAIVLVDLVNQFRARGHDVRAALVHGGSRRVRPIVMTALATIFALLPMALGVTGHSGFISQPLAITVIGGLLSSTVLTLLVLPALYAVVEGPRERRRARRAAKIEASLAADGIE